MNEVTQILSAIAQGDPHAASQLLPLVYQELRQLAAHKLAHERPGQTLQPTALVHEAYLRLVGNPERERGDQATWDNRRHFFAAAAEAMRRVLVEDARRKQCQKHGGGLTRQALDPEQITAPEIREDLIALDEALTKLSIANPQAAQLVQLRYFAGLSIPEAAQTLGMSPRSADRLWAYARAWLHREITGAAPNDTAAPEK